MFPLCEVMLSNQDCWHAWLSGSCFVCLKGTWENYMTNRGTGCQGRGSREEEKEKKKGKVPLQHHKSLFWDYEWIGSLRKIRQSKYSDPIEGGTNPSVTQNLYCFIKMLFNTSALLGLSFITCKFLHSSITLAFCWAAFPAHATWLQVIIWHQWGKYQLPRSLQLYSTQDEYLTRWQLQTSWYANEIWNGGVRGNGDGFKNPAAMLMKRSRVDVGRWCVSVMRFKR